eukprot:7312715-Prymnesium_polylepis.2
MVLLPSKYGIGLWRRFPVGWGIWPETVITGSMHGQISWRTFGVLYRGIHGLFGENGHNARARLPSTPRWHS